MVIPEKRDQTMPCNRFRKVLALPIGNGCAIHGIATGLSFPVCMAISNFNGSVWCPPAKSASVQTLGSNTAWTSRSAFAAWLSCHSCPRWFGPRCFSTFSSRPWRNYLPPKPKFEFEI